MVRVLSCLGTEHDWRLIAIAALVCFLASVVVLMLLRRAQVTQGRTRLVWLGLDTAAAGFGIWATHFIAMLAFEPGVPIGFDLAVTALSLIIAIVITGGGLAVIVWRSVGRWSAPVGGGLVGIAIAAMHFTGMAAVELPARLDWSLDLVLASIAFGVGFGSLALAVATRHDHGRAMLAGSLLLTLAIVLLHFTAMGAIVITPDPTRVATGLALSSGSLSLVIASAAAAILGMCIVGALADRQSEEKVRAEKVKLDAALANMSEGLCMFDAQGRVVLFNERYRELAGLPADVLTGVSLLDLFRRRKTAGDFWADPEEYFADVMAGMNLGKRSMKVVETPKGRTIRISESPMQGGGCVATFEDITDWRRAEAQISHMARHDALTDLPNRTLFREQMELALRRVRRDEKIAVFCLDLDHFKEVNDSLGHPVGDELLKAVAQRLRQCVRETDTLARLGGDEFAIVQVGANDQPTNSAALASRLIDFIGMPYEIAGHHVVVGTTIGVAIAPTDGLEPDLLLKKADMALYRAKSDGRGLYRYFEPEMDAQAQERRLLELDLRAALTRGEFELKYQPIQHLETGAIIAIEALVRWNHPKRGMLLPEHFIGLAEQTGLIVPLGDFVLRTACAQAAGWPQQVCVAVNLSPVQFKNRKLVAGVMSALSASGLAPSRLELEITESVLLQDCEGTLATLHRLRQLGVRIAMDDFGTGYSSLSYLRSFPFDKIKIDRSFIHDLAKRDESMAIVRAVTGLGKSLGIATTAEGVETGEQLTMLRSEGCTEVQGYLFSPPLPAAEVAQLLAREAPPASPPRAVA